MSDYYYENDILPPDVHFRMPSWLKHDDDAASLKDDTMDSVKDYKKQITPPNSPTSPMIVPQGTKDKLVVVNDAARGLPRNGKDRSRKKRSMSTSFSFSTEDRRGIEMAYLEGRSNRLQQNGNIEKTSTTMLCPTFYNPSVNEGKVKNIFQSQ